MCEELDLKDTGQMMGSVRRSSQAIVGKDECTGPGDGSSGGSGDGKLGRGASTPSQGQIFSSALLPDRLSV